MNCHSVVTLPVCMNVCILYTNICERFLPLQSGTNLDPRMFWILLLPLLLHSGYACMRPAPSAPPGSVTDPSTTAPPAPPASDHSFYATNVGGSSEPANMNE